MDSHDSCSAFKKIMAEFILAFKVGFTGRFLRSVNPISFYSNDFDI